MSYLSQSFRDWLVAHADSLDQSNQFADELLQRVADEGVFKLGIPSKLGGNNSSAQQVIEAISEISQYSLTAGFITWGHRTFIENILQSENPLPRTQWLPDLLNGKLAGGTALSNAMKFLAGIEELNVTICEEKGECYLNGRLPWVTNLRADHFAAVFIAGYETPNGREPIVIAIPSDAQGLTRTEELDLIALQGSNTAALIFDKVKLNDDWILSHHAPLFLSQIRPHFLGFQFGMAFGLAERSLNEVENTLASNRVILQPEWEKQKQALTKIKQQLATGLVAKDSFIQNPKSLFKLRIDIVDVVAQSVLLELQAGGGRGYLRNAGSDFIRRWREAAFLPVVTPSAVQLRLVLAA